MQPLLDDLVKTPFFRYFKVTPASSLLINNSPSPQHSAMLQTMLCASLLLRLQHELVFGVHFVVRCTCATRSRAVPHCADDLKVPPPPHTRAPYNVPPPPPCTLRPQVDLYCECPLWPDDGMCSLRDCSVCECEEQEVPEPWRKAEAVEPCDSECLLLGGGGGALCMLERW